MPKTDWQTNTVERLFADDFPATVHSVLDVGCGLSMKSQYLDAQVYVGVDIHRPYLEAARKQSAKGSELVLLNLDALDLCKVFLPQSFDVVMCFDVLEHLRKADALKLLTMCEILARKAVCIETPLGFVPQNIDILGLGGDRWQTHRSAWHCDELHELGYTVSTRDYLMDNVQRHTYRAVDPHIQMIDAIKRMDR